MHGRFEYNAVLKQMYTDFLAECYALGHMENLDPSQLNEAYFLPHHGVVRDEHFNKAKSRFQRISEYE